MTVRTAALLCALTLVAWVRPAAAARSFDQCQYYVDQVPITIQAPGVWCLRQDLKVTSPTNSAINIQASNTTLDCNDFMLDGREIPEAQAQWGIITDRQKSVTVRNCNVQGFLYGIAFYNSESKGSSILDNRIMNSHVTGIAMVGQGTVRGNAVLNTGNEQAMGASAIFVSGNVDVIDNLISSVKAAPDYNAVAISTGDLTGHIIGNRIRRLPKGVISRPTVGISIVGATQTIVRDNDISGDGLPITVGVFCRFASGRLKGNVIKGMETPLLECDLGPDNDVSY